MADQITSARDVALLATACVAGVLIVPLFPYVGLPVTAASAAGLAYRNKVVASLLAAAVGIGVGAILIPGSAILTVPAVGAVLLAVWLLRTRSAQLVGALLTALVAGATIATDAFTARAAGHTLTAVVGAQATATIEGFKQALGSNGSAVAAQLAPLRSVLITLWPSFYVQTAVYVSVFVVAAIAWAAQRSGVELAVPKARELDLSVHVLWPLVIGLVALAAAQLLGAYTSILRAVGFNLLYVARTLFFLQGVAVFSALFDVPKSGYGKMVALYTVLWIFDQFLLIVSLVGLFDFWANFRRLKRDASTEAIGLEEPPGTI